MDFEDHTLAPAIAVMTAMQADTHDSTFGNQVAKEFVETTPNGGGILVGSLMALCGVLLARRAQEAGISPQESLQELARGYDTPL
jgi:hypothetical protein